MEIDDGARVPQTLHLRASPTVDNDRYIQRPTDFPTCEQDWPRLLKPRTPQRAPANSSKKRVGVGCNLSRLTPGSSHHEKMSAIFHDASKALSPPLLPRPLSVNAKRLRIPLAVDRFRITKPVRASSPTRSAKSLRDAPRRTPLEREPSNSPIRDIGFGYEGPTLRCFGLPSAHCTDNHSGVELGGSGHGSSSSDGAIISHLDSQEVLCAKSSLLNYPTTPPQHGVVESTTVLQSNLRFPSPGVEDWLKQVYDYGSPRLNENPGELSPRRTKSASPPITPSVSRRTLWRPPPGHSTDPPKRKVLRQSPDKNRSPANAGQQFVIYDDGTFDQLAELSPCVEQHRKGRGPKRERCVSYWDEDIFPKLSDARQETVREDGGRQVLGELTALTRAKGFVEGVENAQFQFEVHY